MMVVAATAAWEAAGRASEPTPRPSLRPSPEITRLLRAFAGEWTVHESFDGEFAAKVTTGAYEWKRMAGMQIGG